MSSDEKSRNPGLILLPSGIATTAQGPLYIEHDGNRRPVPLSWVVAGNLSSGGMRMPLPGLTNPPQADNPDQADTIRQTNGVVLVENNGQLEAVLARESLEYRCYSQWRGWIHRWATATAKPNEHELIILYRAWRAEREAALDRDDEPADLVQIADRLDRAVAQMDPLIDAIEHEAHVGGRVSEAFQRAHDELYRAHALGLHAAYTTHKSDGGRVFLAWRQGHLSPWLLGRGPDARYVPLLLLLEDFHAIRRTTREAAEAARIIPRLGIAAKIKATSTRRRRALLEVWLVQQGALQDLTPADLAAALKPHKIPVTRDSLRVCARDWAKDGLGPASP